MAVGKELKRIRSLNGLKGKPMSVASLAGYIGVSPGKLRKWEDNDTNPKKDDVKKIEDYFKVNIADLHTINRFKFYTKEITNEITNDKIQYQNVNLSKLIGEILERLVRAEATNKILIQEHAQKNAKDNKSSFSREILELSKTIDEEADRMFSELQKKSQ